MKGEQDIFVTKVPKSVIGVAHCVEGRIDDEEWVEKERKGKNSSSFRFLNFFKVHFSNCQTETKMSVPFNKADDLRLRTNAMRSVCEEYEEELREISNDTNVSYFIKQMAYQRWWVWYEKYVKLSAELYEHDGTYEQELEAFIEEREIAKKKVEFEKQWDEVIHADKSKLCKANEKLYVIDDEEVLETDNCNLCKNECHCNKSLYRHVCTCGKSRTNRKSDTCWRCGEQNIEQCPCIEETPKTNVNKESSSSSGLMKKCGKCGQSEGTFSPCKFAELHVFSTSRCPPECAWKYSDICGAHSKPDPFRCTLCFKFHNPHIGSSDCTCVRVC